MKDRWYGPLGTLLVLGGACLLEAAAPAAPRNLRYQGGSGGTVWRPFSSDSPWNTPIPPNPVLDPNNAALISDFVNSSSWGPHLDANGPPSEGGWSVPLYWADSTTPRVTMTAEGVGGAGFLGGVDRRGATVQAPIPAGATPDISDDHHMLVVDRDNNIEYGFWATSYQNGRWTCGVGATLDLNGTGVRPPADEAPNWWEAHGARACGYGLSAGLIRPEEIQAGVIEHALIIAYPHIRSRYFTPPASTAQGTNGMGAEPDRGVPCGGRMQYDPSINVDALPLSDAWKIILKALQKYGAYVGDFSGAIDVYIENSPASMHYWDSIGFDPYEPGETVVRLSDFRVLEIGPLHDYNN